MNNPQFKFVDVVFAGKFKEAYLGSAYAEDPDDWDLPDKTFSFQGDPGPYFK